MEGGRRDRGRGVLNINIKHGRLGMTKDPRFPSMPGRSMSGFHRPGRHRVHQGRSAVRRSASHMEGELNPIKTACGADSDAMGVCSRIWMTASN